MSTNDDRVLQSARREAVFVLIAWLAALAYTVGYCTLNAYDRAPESLVFYGGIPDWILFGVVTPWLVCVGVSWFFAYGFVADAPLGEELQPDESLGTAEGARHAE